MEKTISKNDVNRWYAVYTNGTGASSLVTFGYVGDIGTTQISTGEDNLDSFIDEASLEVFIDSIGGTDYYKNNNIITE
tara:strand:- start:30 stop:263 length:234 start_codon:yes stop_codon:yes gene_type:complete